MAPLSGARKICVIVAGGDDPGSAIIDRGYSYQLPKAKFTKRRFLFFRRLAKDNLAEELRVAEAFRYPA